MKISEIADKLGIRYKGEDREILRLRDLEKHVAGNSPDKEALYFLESQKFLKRYPEMKEATVLTIDKLSEHFNSALLADDASGRLVFIELLKLFDRRPDFNRISESDIDQSAEIASSAVIHHGAIVMQNSKVGSDSVIFPGVVLEPGSVIGKRCVIRPNTVIGYNCEIGSDCIIHANTTIGADGFGFHDQDEKRYKIPQTGNVIIGNHVEAGAGVTVDRATIESTVVGDYTKLDDQVHIGHNCHVGSYVYIAGGTVLAGSVTIKDRAILGGQSAISGHLTINEKTLIMGLTGVTKDTEKGAAYFGIPARPIKESHRINGALSSLPDLIKRVKEIEDRLSE